MKIIRRIEDINIEKSTVITVGSFDGIHQGHQQILTELKKQSLDCHAEQLKEMGKKYDFTVTVMKPFLINGKVVNSTRIRQLLKDGEVIKAQELLGRKYSITGIVERGSNRGKSLGFPTANLRLANSHKLIPKRGVYAVDVSLQNKIYKGMMNIGYRPTFNFDPLTLEVHIFNFTGSIYDEQLEIQFKKFIRDERKFQNVTQLKNQILKDQEICYKL